MSASSYLVDVGPQLLIREVPLVLGPHAVQPDVCRVITRRLEGRIRQLGQRVVHERGTVTTKELGGRMDDGQREGGKEEVRPTGDQGRSLSALLDSLLTGVLFVWFRLVNTEHGRHAPCTSRRSTTRHA